MEHPEAKVWELLERKEITANQVLRIAEVGSTAHGIAADSGSDDFDATVVRFESFFELVSGDPKRQSMMIRTQPDGVRSRMGDIDLNVYTLRRFASLAAKGNPSILAAIFSPHVVRSIRIDFDELGRRCASKAAGNAFLGYMRQQIDRWVGVRGQKNVTRAELVEAHGYDTKYAAHVLRLGHQGIEYLATGRFSMPMKEPYRQEVLAVRNGELDEREALLLARELEVDLKLAMRLSPLPEMPSKSWVSWVNERYWDLLGVR